MPEKTMTDKESFQIIEQMIGRARQEERASGWGWIIWGSMLITASLLHYWFAWADLPYIDHVWIGFGILATILIFYSAFHNRAQFRKGKARTYTGDLVNKFGNAFFLSLLVLSLGNIATGVNANGSNFGYLLLLYAFWMYIHGSAFRFRLLTYGAFINWTGAVVIFMLYRKLGYNVLLVHALCVFLGYIIPGFVAQKKLADQSKLPVTV